MIITSAWLARYEGMILLFCLDWMRDTFWGWATIRHLRMDFVLQRVGMHWTKMIAYSYSW